MLPKFCRLTASARELLNVSTEKMKLSNRAYTRVPKVARTIRELDGADEIGDTQAAGAVRYRAPDRKYWGYCPMIMYQATGGIPMKRLLPLLLAVALLLSACHADRVDRAAIDDMVAGLDSAKALYDGGDYLGAARAFNALRSGYDTSAEMNYKTAVGYREQVLLPMFEWMGLPEGKYRMTNWRIPWTGIYDESLWKKKDRASQVNSIRWNVDTTLEVLFRNILEAT